MEVFNDNNTGTNDEGLYPNLPLKCLTATSIIGDKVHNKQGEHLGEIKEIMLNINTGEIEYLEVFWELEKSILQSLSACLQLIP